MKPVPLDERAAHHHAAWNKGHARAALVMTGLALVLAATVTSL